MATSSSASETSTTDPGFRVPMQVYIEDTDAYGVLYHTNYLRCVERALHQHKRDAAGDWCVTEIANQKFRSSPLLGQSFTVAGERIEYNPENGMERWSVSLEKIRSTEKTTNQQSEEERPPAVVYNSAIVTICHPSKSYFLPPLFDVSERHSSSSMMIHECSFATYPDEFDIHFPDRLPLRSAMNFFERARTSFLGGPDELRRMKDDDGVLWVVTNIDDGALVGIVDEDETETDPEEDVRCRPGDEIMVRSRFAFRRKGVIECRQSVLLPTTEEDSEPRRLAQAIVTVMAIHAKSRRPTSAPQWLLEKYNYYK